MKNYLEEEYTIIKSEFDLYEIIQFTKLYEVQIIRGEDYQYFAYIDKKCYGSFLTSI